MGRKTETCTIYKLTNIVNGKFYIGQTWRSLKDRPGTNGSGYTNCRYLYASIKKHGIDNFEYSVLLTCTTQEEADFYETTYIEELDSTNTDIGYNLKGGGNVPTFTEETLKKMSENNSKHFLGVPCSEERKQNISKAKKAQGIKLTDEQKKALSESSLKWHAENDAPMLGKHHTEESKKKMSEAQKGKIISEEEMAKRSKTIDSKRDKVLEQQVMEEYFDYKEIDDICTKYKVSAPKIYRILARNNKEKRPIKISDSTREKIRQGNLGNVASKETLERRQATVDLKTEQRFSKENKLSIQDLCSNDYDIVICKFIRPFSRPTPLAINSILPKDIKTKRCNLCKCDRNEKLFNKTNICFICESIFNKQISSKNKLIIVDNNQKLKQCLNCFNIKEVCYFSRNTKVYDNLTAYCNVCRSDFHKQNKLDKKLDD